MKFLLANIHCLIIIILKYSMFIIIIVSIARKTECVEHEFDEMEQIVMTISGYWVNEV